MEVGRDGETPVGPVAKQAFQSGLEREVEHFDAGVDEGSEGVGFAAAGWPH